MTSKYNIEFYQDLISLSSMDKSLLIRDIFRNNFEKYQDNQFGSSCIDKFLGFRINQTESELRDKARKISSGNTVENWSYTMHGSLSWIGLDPAQLQTPYGELIELMEGIDSSRYSRVIDLGAGYGRLGIIIGLFYPEISFTGVEIVAERVESANSVFKSLDFENCKLIHSNLLDNHEDFDLYFIYDFGDLREMKTLLDRLSKKADSGKKFSIMARGSAINKLILNNHPWLSKMDVELRNSSLYDFR